MADVLASRWEFPAFHVRDRALISQGTSRHQIVLAKPLTWMNLSGEALAPFLAQPDFAPASDLLVVSDDFAIPLGTFRMRAAGSSGGHNGLNSIAQTLGSDSYARLRVGIGPVPEGTSRSDFVLAPWTPADWEQLTKTMPAILEAVECWIEEGIEIAMSRFNQRLAS